MFEMRFMQNLDKLLICVLFIGLFLLLLGKFLLNVLMKKNYKLNELSKRNISVLNLFISGFQ